MGEIKSTLDIIMEKTKGLTATEAEKKAFQKGEVEGKVRGFMQKFQDGILDMDRLKIEMAGLGADKQDMARQTLREECLSRIDVEKDNAPLFDLLKHVAGEDPGPLQQALSVFREDLERQRAKHEAALRETLKHTGFSGSALVPNINADPDWIRLISGKRRELKEKLH